MNILISFTPDSGTKSQVALDLDLKLQEGKKQLSYGIQHGGLLNTGFQKHEVHIGHLLFFSFFFFLCLTTVFNLTYNSYCS